MKARRRVLVLLCLLVFVITLVGAGLILIPVGLVLIFSSSPPNPKDMGIVGVIVGAVYILVPLVAMRPLLSRSGGSRRPARRKRPGRCSSRTAIGPVRRTVLNLALVLVSAAVALLAAELMIRAFLPQQLILVRPDIWRPDDTTGGEDARTSTPGSTAAKGRCGSSPTRTGTVSTGRKTAAAPTCRS